LLTLLRQELEIEGTELRAELFARTLERIFIEERIYKRIEDKKTSEAVTAAVLDGFQPFVRELAALKGLSAALQAESVMDAGKGAAESSSRSKGSTREKARGTELKDVAGDMQGEAHKLAKLDISDLLSAEDIDRLLKIPIRRISLYDIERAKEEVVKIQARLEEVERRLGNLVDYAIGVLKGFIKQLESDWPRKTRIDTFGKVVVKQVARRDIAVRYDGESGYLGTEVSGEKLLEASRFDRLLVLRQNGIYSVVPVPERLFVGKGLLWATVAEKQRVSSVPITLVYRPSGNGVGGGGVGGVPENGAYIKRTVIDTWMTGKDYSLVPEGAEILGFALGDGYEFALLYQPKPRTKKVREVFHADDMPIRSRQAQGIRLTDRVVVGLEVVCAGRGQSMNLQFDADDASSAATLPSPATPQSAEKPSRSQRDSRQKVQKPTKAVKKEDRKAAHSKQPSRAPSKKKDQASILEKVPLENKDEPAVEHEIKSSSVPQPAKGGLLKAALEVAKKGKSGQQDEH
ncbi:MAG: hypothetical protein QHH01_05335, partial [Spirochaetales bacterium]|nr:hypothetical protein [Spirochaetales bacterium]